jgi:hypothetical protein
MDTEEVGREWKEGNSGPWQCEAYRWCWVGVPIVSTPYTKMYCADKCRGPISSSSANMRYPVMLRERRDTSPDEVATSNTTN